VTNPILRILTALVGIPVVLALIYLGSWPFVLFILAAALLAQNELYRLFESVQVYPHRLFGLTVGMLVALGPLYSAFFVAATALGLVFVAASPFFGKKETSPTGMAVTFFGIVYPTGFLTCLSLMRLGHPAGVNEHEAFTLTLATVVLIWISDTCAYYVGKAIGKHPLAPAISPKKTWEGTIAGLLGTVVGTVVFKWTLLSPIAWPHIFVLAFLCGGLGQLGDLAESKLKRYVNVKDSGSILPGHGGVFDRLDAMILVVPAVYLYFYYIIDLIS